MEVKIKNRILIYYLLEECQKLYNPKYLNSSLLQGSSVVERTAMCGKLNAKRHKKSLP